MIHTIDIVLPLEGSEDNAARRAEIARQLVISPDRIKGIRLRKHSIDARQRKVKVQLRLEVAVDEELPEEPKPVWTVPSLTESACRVLIIGAGPAGLFAALKCLEMGAKPIVLERGKDASARRFDLAPILREGRVVEDSNYCFGEGGAGTFSDGKLYTRAKKRGPVADVYRVLVAHGAPEKILTDAHPHIGSNLLPNVVKALRNSIIEHGGEVHFRTKVNDFLVTGDQVRGVTTTDGREFLADSTILATGHSARDIYELLARKEVLMEHKPFAIGFRIEHTQPFIDRQQYHMAEGEPRHELLPAARYRLATKIKDRGVHSFCMCPGGWVVPAATADEQVVVNGMSLSRRDSPFANSGLVTTIEPEDVARFVPEYGILAGIAFQEKIERSAKIAGGNKDLGQVAPAQRAADYLSGKISSDLPNTSYFPGLNPAPLHELLAPAITSRIREGLHLFNRQIRNYASREALLLGFETRTSSPLRIPRDPATLEHPQISMLFPCGEGAGYAGGIVSAALDGFKCAEAAARVKT
ncbi:MAG: NAD(P)/FAD-dependent oxidoreductase [Akkermansiaceae bacterium]